MGFFDVLRGSSAPRQAAELAQHVARRSCAGVWSRIEGRVLQMSVPEARGYIRAHSAEIVAVQTVRSGVAPHRQSLVVELAREAVVETLVCEVARVQRVRMGRRLAA